MNGSPLWVGPGGGSCEWTECTGTKRTRHTEDRHDGRHFECQLTLHFSCSSRDLLVVSSVGFNWCLLLIVAFSRFLSSPSSILGTHFLIAGLCYWISTGLIINTIRISFAKRVSLFLVGECRHFSSMSPSINAGPTWPFRTNAEGDNPYEEENSKELYRLIVARYQSEAAAEEAWIQTGHNNNGFCTCKSWYTERFTYCQRRGCADDCVHMRKLGRKLC